MKGIQIDTEVKLFICRHSHLCRKFDGIKKKKSNLQELSEFNNFLREYQYKN